MDLDFLLDKIENYEPGLIDIIFTFVFPNCHQDQEGKYEYVIAKPLKGTNKLQKEAFKDNKNLKIVILDKNIEVIGEQAFSGCSSLSIIIFNDNLRVIEPKAFLECYSL